MAKLLVVDDEKNLRLVVQKELARQGHSVDTGWAQPAPDHAAPTPGTENPPVIAIT